MPDQEDLGVLLSKIALDVSDLKKGLADGKNELNSFKSLAQNVGDQVKKALAFAGIGFGLYEGLVKLKEFAVEVLDVGKKTEILRLSTYVLAQNLKMSADTVDYYVEKLKGIGLTTERAYYAIESFLKSGLPIDKIAPFVEAIKNIAPTIRETGGQFGPAFDLIMKSIGSGLPRGIAHLEIPGMREFLAVLQKDGDEAVMSVTEKAQAMYDFLIKYSEQLKGVAQQTGDTYVAQSQKMARVSEEAKEALYEVVKPIATAITGEKIKGWEDFYQWVTKNKEALTELGTGIGVMVQRFVNLLRYIGAFTVAHPEATKLAIAALAIGKGLSMVLQVLGGVNVGLGKLGLSLASIAHPYTIVITLTIVGIALLKQVANWINRLQGFETPEDIEARRNRTTSGYSPEGMPPAMYSGDKSPEEIRELERIRLNEFKKQQQKKDLEQMQQEVDEASKNQSQHLKDMLGDVSKGGKGGGKAGPEEDLFGEYLKVLDQERQAKIQAAQDSLEILKAGNEKEKAELEKKLAEGLIDGQAYYAKLQELRQAETAAALKLIEEKKSVQVAAYKDALADIERQDLSPEMKGYRLQEEETKNRIVLAQLNAEAARVKLEGEVKVTQELKRQVEVQKQYKEKAEDMRVEMAGMWGPIAEQEAKIQKLYLDWQRAKEEAIKAGAYTPAYAQTLDQYYQSKINFARSGDQYNSMAGAITQGFSSLADAITGGGQDLLKSLNSFFKSLFNSALKPGLDQLQQLLINGFKALFGEAGSALASAVMGAIGLVGMLLTSGGSSSWSSSGVTSAVTSHEAVRGIIAGDTSIPIAQIGEDLQDALVPTNSILEQIEANTRGGRGGLGGSLDIQVTINGIEEQINAAIERYFREYLVLGARG
jgi:hypothetical protein